MVYLVPSSAAAPPVHGVVPARDQPGPARGSEEARYSVFTAREKWGIVALVADVAAPAERDFFMSAVSFA